MPDATTLIKARKRYGDEMVDQLNEALLLKILEKEILKTRKIRIDTTVVESDRCDTTARRRPCHHSTGEPGSQGRFPCRPRVSGPYREGQERNFILRHNCTAAIRTTMISLSLPSNNM
jgi:hypothetical protein